MTDILITSFFYSKDLGYAVFCFFEIYPTFGSFRTQHVAVGGAEIMQKLFFRWSQDSVLGRAEVRGCLLIGRRIMQWEEPRPEAAFSLVAG
jgi:hypothetical protein